MCYADPDADRWASLAVVGAQPLAVPDVKVGNVRLRGTFPGCATTHTHQMDVAIGVDCEMPSQELIARAQCDDDAAPPAEEVWIGAADSEAQADPKEGADLGFVKGSNNDDNNNNNNKNNKNNDNDNKNNNDNNNNNHNNNNNSNNNNNNNDKNENNSSNNNNNDHNSYVSQTVERLAGKAAMLAAWPSSSEVGSYDGQAENREASPNNGVSAGQAELEEASTVKFDAHVSVVEADGEGLQDLRSVRGRRPSIYVCQAVQQLEADDSAIAGKEGNDKAAGSKGANLDGAENAGMVEESSTVKFHPNASVSESANTEGLQDLRRVKGRKQTAYVSEAVQQLDSDDSDDDGKEGDDKAAGSKAANRDGAVNAGMVEESSIVQFHPNVDIVESANTEGLQDLRRVKGRMQTAYVSEAVQQLDSDDSDDDGKEGDDKAAGSRGANRDGAENAGMVEESSIVQFHPNVDVVESANTEGWQDLRRVKGRVQTAYVTEAVQQLDSDDSDDDGKEGDDKAAGSRGANRDGAENAGMVEESSIVQFHPNVDVVESANTEGWQDLRRVKGRVQTAYVTEAVQQLDSDDSDDDGKEGDDKAAGSKGANRDGAVNAGMVEESSIVQFHPNVDIVESANTEGLQDLRRVKGRMQTAYVSEAVQQLDSDDSDDDGKEGDDKAAGSKGANRDGAVNAGMVEESSIVQFHPNVDVVESANTEGLQDLRRVKGRMQTAYVSEAVQQLDSEDSDDDCKEGDDIAAGSKGANRDVAVNAGMVEEPSTVNFDIDANVDVDELTNGEGLQNSRRVKGRMQTAYVSEAVQQLDADDSDDDGNDKAAGSKGANRDGAVNAGMVEESSTVEFHANVGVVESANTDGLQDLHSAKWSTQNG
ncbi:unnamed protein product, partial [Polarella glacialis]